MNNNVRNLAKLILLPLLVFSFFYVFSCQDDSSTVEDPSIAQAEDTILVIDSTQSDSPSSDSIVAVDSLEDFSAIRDVQENIALVSNKQYIVKIDRLSNGQLRYISWSRPHQMSERPDLILLGGIRTQSGTWGREFRFKDSTLTYKVFVYPKRGPGKVDIVLSERGIKQKEMEMISLPDSLRSL